MTQQFPIFNFEQANPLLMGLGKGRELYKQFKMAPLEIQQQHIANVLNEQKQKQNEIYLKKYPELLAAELSKANLEPEEIKARTGLMGGQLQELQQKMKYNPQLFSAEVAERMAKADDLTRRNRLIQQLLGGGQISGMGPSQGSRGTSPGMQGTMPSPEAIQKSFSEQGHVPQQQSGLPGGMSFAQAALLSHELGLPKPEIIDVDGSKIGVTAFGNVPIATGQNPQEKAFQSSLGAEKGKAYSELVGSYQGISNQNAAIDNMIYLANNDPEFRNVTGPIGSFLTKWTGTPERRALLGQIQTSSGEVTLQIAPALKGAFTGRDQTLISTIKANPNDFPDVFVGKLKAQKLINSALQDRSERAAKYMEQGNSQLEAIKKATKETPLDNYRAQVEDLVNPVRQERNMNGKTYYMRANGKVYEK